MARNPLLGPPFFGGAAPTPYGMAQMLMESSNGALPLTPGQPQDPNLYNVPPAQPDHMTPFDAFGDPARSPAPGNPGDYRLPNHYIQPDQQLGYGQPPQPFTGAVMPPGGAWQEPSVALAPDPSEAPTQRTVRALPVGPSGGSADPSRFEWETANAGTNPDQRLNDLTANAEQSRAENNVDLGPEQTTTTPVPWEGWQALSQAIMSSKPPRIGEGLDWSIAPSRPRRPKPQAQVRPALPLPTMADMLRGA